MIGKKTKKISQTKQTRVEVLRTIAEHTGLANVQVKAVLISLSEVLQSHMHKKGSGEFIIPMLGIKVRRVKKKATKARSMISHLTGQEVMIPGKSARAGVKLTALKPLKLAVAE